MSIHRSAHKEIQHAIEQGRAQEREDTLNWVVAFLAQRGFAEAAAVIKAECFEAPADQPQRATK